MMTRAATYVLGMMLLAGCVTKQSTNQPARGQSDTDRLMIQSRHEEIREMQEGVNLLHRNLMIVGKADKKYGAKLAEAQQMPPAADVLRHLSSDLAALDTIKGQLERKIKRYRDLLVTGNAGL